MERTKKEKLSLAEDIISLVMANEETKIREQIEKGLPVQLALLNMCREFFEMEPIDKESISNI